MERNTRYVRPDLGQVVDVQAHRWRFQECPERDYVLNPLDIARIVDVIVIVDVRVACATIPARHERCSASTLFAPSGRASMPGCRGFRRPRRFHALGRMCRVEEDPGASAAREYPTIQCHELVVANGKKPVSAPRPGPGHDVRSPAPVFPPDEATCAKAPRRNLFHAILRRPRPVRGRDCPRLPGRN